MALKYKKIIKTKNGDVLRFLRKKELKKFNEIYFSEILPKSIKAWKKNTNMEQNIIVPCGNIKLALIKDLDNNKKKKLFFWVKIMIMAFIKFLKIYGMDLNVLEKKRH